MRNSGKGDAKRPLTIPEEQFNKNWEVIFNKEDRQLEPIPFAGMVDTGEDDVSK